MKVNEGKGNSPGALILTVITLAFMAIVTLQSSTAHAAITEADCRACHEPPARQDTTTLHHLVVTQPVPADTARPYPEEDSNGNYICRSCHRSEWDNETGEFTTEIIRDCLVCHAPGEPTTTTLHHLLVSQPVPADTARPYPEGDANGNYGCHSCHQMVLNPDTGVFEIEIIRDCLVCHVPEEPTTSEDHHLLVSQPVPADTARPYPEGDANGNYDCQSCHLTVWDGTNWVTEVIGDCLVCHIPGTIDSAKVDEGKITIRGAGMGLVAGSNLVYVVDQNNTAETCPTDVVKWTNSRIVADSWRYTDGTSCSLPGDIVVVPCAAAEKQLKEAGGSGGGDTKPPKPCNGKKCQ